MEADGRSDDASASTDAPAPLSAYDILAALSTAATDQTVVLHALQSLATEIKSATQTALEVDAFLCRMLDDKVPVIDVRSPGEFEQGHIPGAVSLPLFSDHERSVVGTIYKHQGREAAMIQGMRYVAPKLDELVARARELSHDADGAIGVHCWRGGMRSGAVAWLLRQRGLKAHALAGGYKAFRAWAMASWGDIAMPVPKAKQRKEKKAKKGAPTKAAVPAEPPAAAAATAGCDTPTDAPAAGAPAHIPVDTPNESLIGGLPASLVTVAQSWPGRRVCVIGGRTGVGKTRVLLALRRKGHQVIDLEGLAAHRGSAFGWVGQAWHGRAPSDAPDQPTTEHFGNLLALAWRAANQAGAHPSTGGRGWLFLEDEDTHIGGATLPAALYAMLRCAPLIVRVHIGEAARIALLIEDYASPQSRGEDEAAWLERMEDSVLRLGKRIGGAEVNALQGALRAREYAGVARRLIAYYDKLYDAHVLNGSGSGSGTGTRPGAVLEAAQPDELPELDAELIARLVLQRVDEFDVSEAAAAASIS